MLNLLKHCEHWWTSSSLASPWPSSGKTLDPGAKPHKGVTPGLPLPDDWDVMVVVVVVAAVVVVVVVAAVTDAKEVVLCVA